MPLQHYSEFALIVSVDYRFFHLDFNGSPSGSFEQCFGPSAGAVAVCSRKFSFRNPVDLRTVAFGVDNVDSVSFCMQMLVDFAQFLQEVIGVLRFFVDVFGFLYETWRLALASTLLQYQSSGFFIDMLIQSIDQTCNPFSCASAHLDHVSSCKNIDSLERYLMFFSGERSPKRGTVCE
jgi:hypothetical protein